MTLRYRSAGEYWTIQYRGIACEIKRWWITKADGTPYEPHYGKAKTWNYYLSLHEAQVSAPLLEALSTPLAEGPSGYMSREYSAAMGSLDWKGGMTYYEIEGGLDGQPRIFKGGCDYNHSWDEGVDYSLWWVKYDLKQTVNSLIEQWPDLLVRCWYTGKWCERSDGAWTRAGVFESMEAIYQQDEELMTRSKNLKGALEL